MAARSSQDLACCWRATESARSKYVSAFAAPGSGDSSAISPATRLTSASYQLSLVALIAAVASAMLRHASSSWLKSAWAFAKHVNRKGDHAVAPVARHAAIAEVSVWIAFEALP